MVLRFNNYGRNWLLARFRKPKARTEESIRRYRKRLLNSRWDELQVHFGLAIPEPLKSLYKQTTLLSKRQAAAVWTTKVRERCLGKKTAWLCPPPPKIFEIADGERKSQEAPVRI
jgi:hypothetical protein